MTKERFLALFRWEKPVEMNSVMSVPEVMARLRSVTVIANTWLSWNRLTSDAPLVGWFTESGGAVRLRTNLLSTPPGRQLVFRLEPWPGGTRLVGVLRLRLWLQMYQLCGVVAMFALQGGMIYHWLSGGERWSWRGAEQILQQFGLIPFIWCYIRFCLWWTRKKEARTLELVRAALVPLPSVEARVVDVSTPTEIFIRPRH